MLAGAVTKDSEVEYVSQVSRSGGGRAELAPGSDHANWGPDSEGNWFVKFEDKNYDDRRYDVKEFPVKFLTPAPK